MTISITKLGSLVEILPLLKLINVEQNCAYINYSPFNIEEWHEHYFPDSVYIWKLCSKISHKIIAEFFTRQAHDLFLYSETCKSILYCIFFKCHSDITCASNFISDYKRKHYREVTSNPIAKASRASLRLNKQK